MSVPDICEFLGADSLGYLPVESVTKIAQNAKCGFCNGCFSGKYPVPEPPPALKNKFEQKIGKVSN